MEEVVYWYHVPVLLQKDGEATFWMHVYKSEGGPIDSLERYFEMINVLTRAHVEGEPEEGTLPVVPITWKLITAKRGSGVKAPKAKGSRKTKH